MTIRFTCVLAALLIVSLGCDEETTPADSGPAGVDSGGMVDSGGVDSGGGTDSGPGDDAGPGVDSGPGDDAGGGCVGSAAAQYHCMAYEMFCGFSRAGLFASADECRCAYDTWGRDKTICAANALGRASSDPDGECANASGMDTCL